MELRDHDGMISSNYGMPIPKNQKYHRLERHGTRSFIKAARRRCARTRTRAHFSRGLEVPLGGVEADLYSKAVSNNQIFKYLIET